VASSDVYTFSSTVTLTAITATPLLSVVMGTTLRGWVVGVRFKIGTTAAAAGNQVNFQLCRPGNTMTGTTTAAGAPHDFSAPAAVATGYTAWSTAPTVGTLLGPGWMLPQTTGSDWEEFPPTNYEWGIPAIANGAANAGVHLFATASVATSTPVTVDLIMSE
jgi:hypothetical protein